jgi:oligopeptide transport system permease protein
MQDLTRDLFVIEGRNAEKMESISRPNISFWQDAWRRLRKNRAAFAGMVIVIIYALLAIFAPMLSHYSFSAMDATAINAGPSAAHWLGCDSTGRDLWVRTWMGARVSLTIGLCAATINMCVGAVMGGLCGYFGGKLDMIMMRIVDILYGIPSLIVTILLMVVMGTGVGTLIAAMCIVGWIGTCRFVRGETFRLRERDFVLAARLLGVSNFKIICRHIIPNIMGLLITNLCLAIPGAIFQEAFLSYIGLGIAPPNCSWGLLAKDGIKMLRVAPHEIAVPTFFICTTMLALNLLGDGLRDAFDPNLRGTE